MEAADRWGISVVRIGAELTTGIKSEKVVEGTGIEPVTC
jgi:hypothetical protein